MTDIGRHERFTEFFYTQMDKAGDRVKKAGEQARDRLESIYYNSGNRVTAAIYSLPGASKTVSNRLKFKSPDIAADQFVKQCRTMTLKNGAIVAVSTGTGVASYKLMDKWANQLKSKGQFGIGNLLSKKSVKAATSIGLALGAGFLTHKVSNPGKNFNNIENMF